MGATAEFNLAATLGRWTCRIPGAMDAGAREAESFYDYARQQWMLRPGRRDRKQLEGVMFR